MNQKYAVMDLGEPELFDLRLALDNDTENIKDNKRLAREWRNISRYGRYIYNFAEGMFYAAPIAHYVINPNNMPDELNLLFSAIVGSMAIGFSVAKRLTFGRGFKEAEKEYSRRYDSLGDRLEDF